MNHVIAVLLTLLISLGKTAIFAASPMPQRGQDRGQ